MSPLLEADLRGVPATCLLVPEFDINRDKAFAYASRLEAAGVEVELRHYHLPWVASMAGYITAGCRPSMTGLSAAPNAGVILTLPKAPSGARAEH
jgi:acetyl esterase/lipase